MTKLALTRSCLLLTAGLLAASTSACVVDSGDPSDADTDGAADAGDTDGDDDDDAADETGDDDDDGAQVDGIADIEGWVTTAAGDPLEGVQVTAPGGSATTDADGHFVFSTAADDGDTIVVELESAGWVRGHERFEARDGAINVVRAVMMPEALPVPLDATGGGMVLGTRNAAVVAPPNAFVHADGSPAEGMVDVHLTPLNPAVQAEYDAYPGDGLARDAGGTLIQLETFGVLDVTVRQNGEELNIADGMGVEVQIPLPDPAPADPPETMPLWSFDEEAGVWAEEGTLTLDAEAGVYRGTLPHLSPWNADQPLSATCIRGRVEDPEGNPVAGAMVFAQGVDYLGGSTAVTDGDGEFCVAVRKDSTVEVTAYGLDGSITRTVDSGDADTEVPVQCDVDCLDTGLWTLIPGEGDPTWGGGYCEPPDEDTWISFEADAFGTVVDLQPGDDFVACGFQMDDPAAGPDEPPGTTMLTYTDDEWTTWVIMGRGSDQLGAVEGTVAVQRNESADNTDAVYASCMIDVDEAEEVDDDIFVVGGGGTCEAFSLSSGFATSPATVDFRGIAGLFDGVIPLICCDVDPMAMPGFP